MGFSKKKSVASKKPPKPVPEEPSRASKAATTGGVKPPEPAVTKPADPKIDRQNPAKLVNVAGVCRGRSK